MATASEIVLGWRISQINDAERMVDLVSVLKRLFALPIQGMTRIHVIECVQEMRVPVSVKDFKYTLSGVSVVPLVKE